LATSGPKSDAMQHAGLILAAGASSRMGRPKALLPTGEGSPLALSQVSRLREAGCEPVVIVLGSDFDVIAKHLAGCTVVHNANWEKGRFSSVQCGLRSLNEDGVVVLPVDTVGVAPETIRQILDFAEEETPVAVRPTYDGNDGKLAWVSNSLAKRITEIDEDTRLDHILRREATALPVDDPAILTNVNTPAEWGRITGGD